MIFYLHLYVTYDNDKRYFSNCCFISNLFAYFQAQVKEKDNRPASNQCGYLFNQLGATVTGVPFTYLYYHIFLIMSIVLITFNFNQI